MSIRVIIRNLFSLFLQAETKAAESDLPAVLGVLDWHAGCLAQNTSLTLKAWSVNIGAENTL